jgi:hypothetical protein
MIYTQSIGPMHENCSTSHHLIFCLSAYLLFQIFLHVCLCYSFIVFLMLNQIPCHVSNLTKQSPC